MLLVDRLVRVRKGYADAARSFSLLRNIPLQQVFFIFCRTSIISHQSNQWSLNGNLHFKPFGFIFYTARGTYFCLNANYTSSSYSKPGGIYSLRLDSVDLISDFFVVVVFPHKASQLVCALVWQTGLRSLYATRQVDSIMCFHAVKSKTCHLYHSGVSTLLWFSVWLLPLFFHFFLNQPQRQIFTPGGFWIRNSSGWWDKLSRRQY